LTIRIALCPWKTTLHNVSSQFRHTLPGFSIQVIEFDEQ